MYLTTVGFCFLAANLLLIETRLYPAAIGFGVVAGAFFVQALRVK